MEIFALSENEKDIGLLELDYTDKHNIEVAYFGLAPAAVGKGQGRWMMKQAIKMAWSRPTTKRLWVHTCTVDHPKALAFYIKSGFTPYARKIEIADDPRLDGHLPPECGSHHPIIEAQ